MKKGVIIISFSILLIFLISFFWLRNGESSNKNLLGKQLKRILEGPEIKKVWHSHKKKVKLVWKFGSKNREHNRLKPYFQENSRIVVAKMD